MRYLKNDTALAQQYTAFTTGLSTNCDEYCNCCYDENGKQVSLSISMVNVRKVTHFFYPEGGSTKVAPGHYVVCCMRCSRVGNFYPTIQEAISEWRAENLLLGIPNSEKIVQSFAEIYNKVLEEFRQGKDYTNTSSL